MTTGTMSCRKGAADLFHRMHDSVLDYTLLLDKEWDKRLRSATTELEREMVVMEMWEDVEGGEKDREDTF